MNRHNRYNRQRKIILVCLLFFCMGCSLTISFLIFDGAISAGANASLDVHSKMSHRNTVEYAVLILSAPDNVYKRDVVRATWKNFASNIFVENGEKIYAWNHSRSNDVVPHNFIKFYFVLGTKDLDQSKLSRLELEQKKSNDLLLLDSVKDSYNNLSNKLKQALKWFSDNLINLNYVIKCDDDSFVRIDLIVQQLEAYAPNMDAPEVEEYTTKQAKEPYYKGLYWGYFNGKASIQEAGKWREKDWFLCDHYLPYALGGGYVLSREIVDYVARNIDHLRVYLSEDVSVGVWTAALHGINRVHDVRFDTEYISRGCKQYMLVRHNQDRTDMLQMYVNLVHTKGLRLCKAETSRRRGYFYKWNRPPSQCCTE